MSTEKGEHEFPSGDESISLGDNHYNNHTTQHDLNSPVPIPTNSQPQTEYTTEDKTAAVRTQGLGSMSKLPDQFIARIFRGLSITREIPETPLDNVEYGLRNLFPLMLVSQAFYQFASWEEYWRLIVVDISQGDFEYNNSWRVTARLVTERLRMEKRERESGKLEEKTAPKWDVNARLTHIPGFYSEYMYKKWYRSSAPLHDFSFESGHVPRVQRVKENEFIQRFDEPRRPVIITDIVYKWNAITEWTPERLVERFGDHVLKLATSDAKGLRTKMTFRNYFRYMHLQKDEKPLYVFDNGFAERIPELLKDFKIPPYFWKDYFSLLGRKRPDYRWMVIGPERSGTNFHIDPNGTSAWNALLVGRKRWALYPPDVHPPGIHLWLDTDGSINHYKAPSPLKWFFEVYPFLTPDKKPIEFIQNAGDMVYIPAGWWHMVLNLEQTVSVTQNFVNDQNITLAATFLYNQDERELIDLWLDALKEASPEKFIEVKTKLKLLIGKDAIAELKELKKIYEEEKQEWGKEKEALLNELNQLKEKINTTNTV